MRKTLVATVLLLLAAACGGGEQKEAFERYESSIQPLLRQDETLRSRFREEVKDANVYSDESGVSRFVRRKLIPFYDRMAEEVESIALEDAKLAPTHAGLGRYAKNRRSFCNTFLEFVTLEAKGRGAVEPALAKVEEAKQGLAPFIEAMNAAYRRAPGVAGRLSGLFEQETALGEKFYALLAQLSRGRESSRVYLDTLDRQFLPFYAEARKTLSGLELEGDEKAFVSAALAYLDAVEQVIRVSRAVAHVRAGLEQELRPVGLRLEQHQQEGTRLLEEYRKNASQYRESLH